MRVLLDTTYARRAPHCGTGVYLERIAAALAQLPDIDLLTEANGERRPPGGGGVASIGNALADLRWTERELPRRARHARADVIHHPLPALAHATRTPQVITVHDLAFVRHPERFAGAYRRYAAVAHRHAARRAAAVICVSEATAADVRELWGVAGDRIVVAHHGPGQQLPHVARATEPTHLLYVGDDEPRKDLATLLRAHRLYARTTADPLPLVLAGTAAARDGVVVEPCPTPARLAQLLAGAAALVHPAVHEGFGLTALEAMAAGTPVIAAATPATIEVCAGAARYVTPHNAPELAGAIAELAVDPERRERLAGAGQQRAAAFSWKLAARAHREAYAVALRR